MRDLRTTLTPEQQEWFDEGRRRIRIERWTLMEHTTNLIERRERIRARGGDVRGLDETIAEALVRDEAALGRPEGCWCFGLGGRDRAVVAIGENTKPSFQGDIVGEHPVTQHDDPEYVWLTTCPYCTEGREAEQRKREIASALRAGREVMPARGWQAAIPQRMQEWRLNTSPLLQVDNAEQKTMLFNLTGGPPASYCFWGDVRVGKTGLCISMAWEWREARLLPTVAFWPLPDLLQAFRNDYSRKATDETTPTEGEILKQCSTVPLLILDDLCAESVAASGEQWRQDRLYQIINTRMNNGLVTLFTSNKNEADMLAILGPRIYWRIMDMVTPARMIAVVGPNQSMKR